MWQELGDWKIQKRYMFIIFALISIGGKIVNDYWKIYRKKLYLSKLRKDKQKSKLIQKGTISHPSDVTPTPVSLIINDKYFLYKSYL